MKNLIYFLLLAPLFLAAQTKTQYCRAKIFFDEQHQISNLLALGVEVEHGHQEQDLSITSDFSTEELHLIEEQGFKTEILIKDVIAYYQNQNRDLKASDRIEWKCSSLFNYKHNVPKNFKLGSMIGFYTYAEMLKNLSDMKTQYSNLISTATPIDTFKTIEKRPIYWVKISNNPTINDTTKSQVLYTALHHAREPASLSQMIYYMWYILENYDKSAEIKYLVDNTEMYFIPCVNPDGYLYNEKTNPQGGGLWRKNRRINADKTEGVDLCRNYGYQWGFDNIGSSNSGNSQTYRGTNAFSEPETQAIKAFSNSHQFVAAMNYHTPGNHLIYPWAYSDKLADSVFYRLSNVLTNNNQFKKGTPIQTLGYQINGWPDDWLYSTNKTIAFTPEVGELENGISISASDFWPIKAKIPGMCQDNLYMNILLSGFANKFALINNISSKFTDNDGKVEFEIQRIGLKSGSFDVSLTPLSKNITSTGADIKNIALNIFEKQKNSISFNIAKETPNGEEILFLLGLNNGIYIKYDTIKMYLQKSLPFFNDKANDMTNWEKSGWGISTKSFVSPPSSFADSPVSNYIANVNNTFSSINSISLPQKSKITLNFWAKWDIEPNSSAYASVSIASNPQGTFELLCGRFTHIGTEAQSPVRYLPIYDGYSDWVQEEIDISKYAGKKIYLKFLMSSGKSAKYDGIYIDDIQIRSENEGAIDVVDLKEDDFKISINPNPANDYININVEAPLAEKDIQLLLFDISGKNILQRKIQNVHHSEMIQLNNLPSGVYFYQVVTAKYNSKLHKLIVID